MIVLSRSKNAATCPARLFAPVDFGVGAFACALPWLLFCGVIP